MGLLSKKKNKDEIHTLTEKEIQDKLYGAFRASDSISAVTIKKKKVEVSADPRSHEKLSFQQPLRPVSSTGVDSRSHENSYTDKDLFRGGRTDEADHLKAREKKKEQERLARFSEWADEEDQLVKSATPSIEPKRSAAHRIPKPIPFAGVLPIIGGVISGFLSIFKRIPYRLLLNRQLAYWTGAALFLFLIFSGIQFLNIQREAAMKNPRKAERSEETAPVAHVTSKEKTLKQQPGSPLSTPETLSAEAAGTAQADAANLKTSDKSAPFVIQVATYAVESDADALLKRINGENFSGFVRDLRRGSGKIYYSVFLGRFKTYEQAQKTLESFRKKDIAKSFEDAFIRTI